MSTCGRPGAKPATRVYAAYIASGPIEELHLASNTGEVLLPCRGALTLAPPAPGWPASLVLTGALRGLRHKDSMEFLDCPSADVDVLASPAAALELAKTEVSERTHAWEGMFAVHGPEALPARVCPDAAGRAVMENIEIDDADPPIALLECCAAPASLPALRRNPDAEIDEVYAADEDAYEAERRRHEEAGGGKGEEEEAKAESEEEEEDSDEEAGSVLDPSAPPLLVQPGDLRLTLRWEERQGHCEPGFRAVYLLRRAGGPPAVLPPRRPPQEYRAYMEYIASDDF